MFIFNYRNSTIKMELNTYKLFNNNGQIMLTNKLLQQNPIYYIKFTSGCNLSCSYCFQHQDKVVRNNIDFKESFSILDEILNNEENDLVLFGGEPFLDENLHNLNVLFEKLKIDRKISGFTNGCFTPQMSDFIYKYRGNFGNLIISLDGIEKIHNKRRPMKGENSFKKIIENIHKLLDFNVSVLISINIDLNNINSLEELIDFLTQEFGMGNIPIVLNRVRHSKFEIGEQQLLRIFVDISKKYNNPFIGLNSVVYKKLWYVLNDLGYMKSRCRVGLSYVIDFEQGMLYTCPQISDTNIGNFSKNEFIINENRKQEFFNSVNKNNNICSICEYVNYCKYGCISEDIPYDICKFETERELKIIFENFEYFYELKDEYLELLNIRNTL